MFNFGAGRARLIPAGGGTAVELGVVQSASVELKVDLKELRGPYRYPIAVADGKGTASGKVMFMQLWPASLAAILSGTQTTGASQAAIAETGTVATTTYLYALANGATYVVGSEIVTVIIGGTTAGSSVGGTPVFYVRGTTPAAATLTNPTAGVYSISASGSLTFAAGDVGNTVQVTYLYTPTVATANVSVALSQVGMNTAPTFQLTLIGVGKNIYTNQAQQFITQFNSCLAPSLKMDFKLDDYTGLDVDYQAFIDATGTLGSFHLVNATN